MNDFERTRGGFAMSASGARFERELGRQGQAPAIGPTMERTATSVTGRPSFSSYFSFDAILRQLVKLRVRAMTRRREDAFYAAHLKGQPQPETSVLCDAADYLPSRNLWKRPRAANRSRCSAEQIATQAMLRTVYRFRQAGRLGDVAWGRRLEQLVARVYARIAEGDCVFSAPRIFLRHKNAEHDRALAMYENIEDRLILGGLSAYLRGLFDPYVSPHCHSFRMNREKSHQSAVAELIAYRRVHAGETLYVAECDIMKFFDVVDHREAIKTFDAFAEKCGGVDARARDWIEAYFESYGFQEALERAKDGAAGGLSLPVNRVERVSEKALAALHPGEDVAQLRLGLPQGGALSPIFANILLAEADEAVVGEKTDSNLLYIRFCDDMIIVHTDRAKCQAAMRRYMDAVKRCKLPVHPARKDGFAYGTEYYELKTKDPFEWRQTRIGERNAASWVSFLGYHINYQGETRIRKETIRKHLCSLKRERICFDRRIAEVSVEKDRICLIRHFIAHLVAKGIGFLKAGTIREDSLCWAAAFPNLSETASCECVRQMRTIDAVRERMMYFPLKSSICQYHFMGRPFSYFGYLVRVTRPDRYNVRKSVTCSDARMYAQI